MIDRVSQRRIVSRFFESTDDTYVGGEITVVAALIAEVAATDSRLPVLAACR